MELVTLTKSTGWYGSHSGYYEQLPKYLSRQTDQKIIAPRKGWLPRAFGKAIATVKGLPIRNQSSTLAETEFLLHLSTRKNRIGFIAAVENHLPMLNGSQGSLSRIVAAIHFPPSRWSKQDLSLLGKLDSALVLYTRDIPFFEEFVGEGRVRYVPHGVDTEFFSPPEPNSNYRNGPRLLAVGQFDRDFEMMNRTLRKLIKRCPKLRFDLVIAPHGLTHPGVKEILELSNSTLHQGISDTALRDLYRSATALFLPMKASGANNAIVEALSCGTPIITNDVGGIRDYGGATTFPIASSGDELIDLAGTYLEDNQLVHEIGTRCRNFAETNLKWDKVADLHLKEIKELAESRNN